MTDKKKPKTTIFLFIKYSLFIHGKDKLIFNEMMMRLYRFQ